jgi:MOSC domain-containing protein YiiM
MQNRSIKARFEDHLSQGGAAPQEVPWNEGVVSTSIFKAPVAGSVRVVRLDLQGDKQADLTVPGGPKKAVYRHASELRLWAAEMANALLQAGHQVR